MSDPQFPDPLGVRELIVPGGTSHKAGPMLEDRLKAVERGAANRSLAPESLLTTRGDLIRRGASAPERVALGASGQVLGSDGTDAVWKSRPVRTLAASCSVYAGSLTTGEQVLCHAGVLRAASACADAVLFRYNSSDWTVGGVTPQFVLVSTYSNNATAPGVTLNALLGVLTSLGGGGGSLSLTASTVVTNAHASMTAGSVNQVTSALTTLSSGDTYALFANTASGSQAANSFVNLTVKLYAVYP